MGLTEAGERLHASLTPAFAQMRAAVESLNELRERPTGTLRLTVPRGVTAFLNEPMIAEFLELYPGIGFDISFDDGLTDIVAQGFDAGIRFGETLEKDMIAVDVFGPERFVVVGSPAYFARHPKPKHPRNLLAHDCIGHRSVTSGGLYRWELDEDGEKSRSRSTRASEVLVVMGPVFGRELVTVRPDRWRVLDVREKGTDVGEERGAGEEARGWPTAALPFPSRVSSLPAALEPCRSPFPLTAGPSRASLNSTTGKAAIMLGSGVVPDSTLNRWSRQTRIPRGRSANSSTVTEFRRAAVTANSCAAAEHEQCHRPLPPSDPGDHWRFSHSSNRRRHRRPRAEGHEVKGIARS